jgi:ribonuclease HI
MSDLVEIYADGACKGNPGVGGWGAMIVENGGKREILGGEAQTPTTAWSRRR